jgi:ppGpp synthetase/RelA/SpoT-type nucleotidyltranferase
MENAASLEQPFNFEEHRSVAIKAYTGIHPLCQQAVERVCDIIRVALQQSDTKVHSVQGRAKNVESFARKAIKPSESNPNAPKYAVPLHEITDKVGVRVITFSPKTLIQVQKIIEQEFLIIEKIDKGKELSDEGKFGYQSIHYLVKMTPKRASLTEYRSIAELMAEIQLRTILQHAWAEMEHDIQYKSSAVIPTSVRRRFMALAGILEIADREFQAVQDEDERLRAEARQSLEMGNLAKVEITPDALRTYLDQKLGPDRRSTDFSYELTANLLRKMGFTNFQQIEDCIASFNPERTSRLVWGTRQGQISRFETVLRAGMGENYNRLHPWWRSNFQQGKPDWILEQLREKGVVTGNYVPADSQEH